MRFEDIEDAGPICADCGGSYMALREDRCPMCLTPHPPRSVRRLEIPVMPEPPKEWRQAIWHGELNERAADAIGKRK